MTLAAKEGLEYQEGHERALAEMANVRLQRATEYGEDRYRETDQDFNMGGVFWDLYRKFIRLKQQYKRGWRRNASLRDTFVDLGNYSAMGLQLFDMYNGRQVAPIARARDILEEIAPLSVVNFRIEQVAIACNVQAVKDNLGIIGLDTWVDDEVRAKGRVMGVNGDVENRAKLAFNYQLGPFELELIEYLEGHNWLERRPGSLPRLSHLGLHIPQEINLDQLIADMNRVHKIGVAQRVTTQSHSNAAIRGKRRYEYVVFDSIVPFGFDLKLIRRLNQDGSIYMPEK
jgi:hypothetical protein